MNYNRMAIHFFYIVLIVKITFFTVSGHVDDVFYLDSTTPSSLTIGWYGEDDAAQHVKSWKIFVNGEERHVGTPDQLTQDSRIEIDGNLNAGPGEEVKVTVTAVKQDETIVHPLLNYYCTLAPLPVENVQLDQEKSTNELAGSGKLSWTPGSGSTQDRYNIRYQSVLTESSMGNYTAYSQSWSFSGLNPGDTYMFRIVARSGDAKSDATAIELELHPGHVTNVKIESYPDGRSLGLKWTKPPGIVHKMEAYIESNDDEEGTGDIDMQEDHLGASVSNLQPGCTYMIHICAVGRTGKKGLSVDVAATTVPDINSAITLSEPASETSATLEYTETDAKFDFYHIKLNTKEESRPFFDKQRNDPHRSVTFSDLIPGTPYEVLLYTMVNDRAGAAGVHSQPFLYTFKTAGVAPSKSSSSDTNIPLAAVIAMGVGLALLLLIVIILGIILCKSRRKASDSSERMNNKLNSNNQQGNMNRPHNGSVNRSGPQPTGPMSSYLEVITNDAAGKKDSMGYEKPVNRGYMQDDEPYEDLRIDDANPHSYDSKAYKNV